MDVCVCVCVCVWCIYLSVAEFKNAYHKHNQSSDELEHSTYYHYSS